MLVLRILIAGTHWHRSICRCKLVERRRVAGVVRFKEPLHELLEARMGDAETVLPLGTSRLRVWLPHEELRDVQRLRDSYVAASADAEIVGVRRKRVPYAVLYANIVTIFLSAQLIHGRPKDREVLEFVSARHGHFHAKHTRGTFYILVVLPRPALDRLPLCFFTRVDHLVTVTRCAEH